MENEQTQTTERKHFSEFEAKDWTGFNHNTMMAKISEGKVAWQDNSPEKQPVRMPVIVGAANGTADMKFSYMKGFNALTAIQSAYEQDFKSNCWLTKEAIKDLDLHHKEAMHGIVLTAIDKNTQERVSIPLYNASSLYGEGIPVVFNNLKSEIPFAERNKQDKLAVLLVEEFAKAMPQEKAIAERAKPKGEKRENLYAVAKDCYNAAVNRNFRQTQEAKNQHSEEYERRFTAIKNFDGKITKKSDDDTKFMAWMNEAYKENVTKNPEYTGFVKAAATKALENGMSEENIKACVEKLAPQAVENKRGGKAYAGWIMEQTQSASHSR